jgi:hypothetical protein
MWNFDECGVGEDKERWVKEALYENRTRVLIYTQSVRYVVQYWDECFVVCVLFVEMVVKGVDLKRV